MLTLPPRLRAWLPLLAVIALTAVVAAACAVPGASPVGSGSHPPTPAPTPLVPAQPGADPLSLLAWVFTPVFQALFIVLVLFYDLTGNIAIAIILLTLVIRALIIPLFRRQTDLPEADAAAPAGDQGDPAAVQGRPHEGQRSHDGALQGARSQPRSRLPAPRAAVRPPHPDVLGHPGRPDQLRPHRDAPHRAMAGSPDLPEPGQRRPHAAAAVHRSHRLRDRLERRRTRCFRCPSSAGSASWRWRRAFCSCCRAGWSCRRRPRTIRSPTSSARRW